MRSVLLQLHIGRPEGCEAWSNIPTAHGVQLTVYVHSNVSPDAERCARHCFAALKRSLVNLGGTRTLSPCASILNDSSPLPVPAYDCRGRAQAGINKRVLIYIADGFGQINPLFNSYFTEPNSIIIPIVDTSLGGQVGAVLPPSFNTQIAEVITGFDTSPVIPRIINLTGIKSAGFRLFISYRHEDAALIAGQLFHKLSERRFDVFLDRFSSRTGDDFVSLVREELFDKACVLVLETGRIGNSIYCRQEVATAEANHLGLMAIDLPGSRTTFPTIGLRLDLSSVTLNVNRELHQLDLDRVTDFIEQNYNDQVSRRTRAQDQSILNAILAAHLRPQPKGVGQYCVNNGHRDYVVSMCRCPPAIDDFIQTESLTLSRSPVARGILFGPISVVQTLRAQQVAWLGQKSIIQAIDEGHILRSMDDIAANRL